MVHLGAILGHPRAILGHPGALLGGLEGDLGPPGWGQSWDILRPSWSYRRKAGGLLGSKVTLPKVSPSEIGMEFEHMASEA